MVFVRLYIKRIKKDFNQNPDEKVLIKAAQLHVDIIDILAQAIKTKAIKFNDIKPYLSSYNLTNVWFNYYVFILTRYLYVCKVKE